MQYSTITTCTKCNKDLTKPNSVDVAYQSWGKTNLTKDGLLKVPSTLETLRTPQDYIMAVCSYCGEEVI